MILNVVVKINRLFQTQQTTFFINKYIDIITISINTILNIPVAYLGFHFGGVQNFSGKVGVLHAARGEATRLVGGFGGMLPRENFKKWCNLVRFREYFAKILSKK